MFTKDFMAEYQLIKEKMKAIAALPLNNLMGEDFYGIDIDEDTIVYISVDYNYGDEPNTINRLYVLISDIDKPMSFFIEQSKKSHAEEEARRRKAQEAERLRVEQKERAELAFLQNKYK